VKPGYKFFTLADEEPSRMSVMDEPGEHSGMQCTKCGTVRELSFFRVRRGKHQQPCKKCYLEYGRRHYQNNKQYYIDKTKRYNHGLWEKTRHLVWNYLREHPCVDCGNSDPRVLEFDHVRGEKTHNVSDLKSQHFCWETILTEIEKCEVRCANCHRIKTFDQFSWRIFDVAS
jgi:hypothetical protein